MSVLLKNISLALADFALEVTAELDHQVTGIFGPSGAGKTSLLDMIAGLRRPHSAFIQLGDTVLTDTTSGVEVPARRRQIGYVPQDLVLFPHLSVRQNLLYGSRPEIGVRPVFRYEHVVEILEIEPLVERGVNHLSGGEQQRVALARALLTSPRLLLLDEPLASLDRALKSRIIPYLARVRDEFRLPMIYVTHDWDEVQMLCHDVLVLENGRFTHRGKPEELTIRFG